MELMRFGCRWLRWQTMAFHPDCGCWMLADGKIRALARGRNPYEGRH